MITLNQYVGVWREHPDWTPTMEQNATKFLASCCALEVEMAKSGVAFPDNPKTKSGISGEVYGGFRPKDCPIGSSKSSHKQARGVDRYDPYGNIDEWCMQHLDRLAVYGIYIEHPSATIGWSHWTDRAPPSGNRAFYP